MGYVVANMYSLWLTVGKFLRGEGSPTPLPLSIQGCPAHLLASVNATVIASFSNNSLSEDQLGLNTPAQGLVHTTVGPLSICIDEEIYHEQFSVH